MRGLIAAALLAGLLAGCSGRREPPAVRHADVNLRVENETVEAVVPPHATLASLLREQQISVPIVERAVASTRSVFDVRHLRANRPYRLVRSLDGLLREFEYEIDADRFLRIAPRSRTEPEQLDAVVVPYEKETT